MKIYKEEKEYPTLWWDYEKKNSFRAADKGRARPKMGNDEKREKKNNCRIAGNNDLERTRKWWKTCC